MVVGSRFQETSQRFGESAKKAKKEPKPKPKPEPKPKAKPRGKSSKKKSKPKPKPKGQEQYYRGSPGLEERTSDLRREESRSANRYQRREPETTLGREIGRAGEAATKVATAPNGAMQFAGGAAEGIQAETASTINLFAGGQRVVQPADTLVERVFEGDREKKEFKGYIPPYQYEVPGVGGKYTVRDKASYWLETKKERPLDKLTNQSTARTAGQLLAHGAIIASPVGAFLRTSKVGIKAAQKSAALLWGGGKQGIERVGPKQFLVSEGLESTPSKLTLLDFGKGGKAKQWTGVGEKIPKTDTVSVIGRVDRQSVKRYGMTKVGSKEFAVGKKEKFLAEVPGTAVKPDALTKEVDIGYVKSTAESFVKVQRFEGIAQQARTGVRGIMKGFGPKGTQESRQAGSSLNIDVGKAKSPFGKEVAKGRQEAFPAGRTTTGVEYVTKPGVDSPKGFAKEVAQSFGGTRETVSGKAKTPFDVSGIKTGKGTAGSAGKAATLTKQTTGRIKGTVYTRGMKLGRSRKVKAGLIAGAAVAGTATETVRVAAAPKPALSITPSTVTKSVPITVPRVTPRLDTGLGGGYSRTACHYSRSFKF